MMKGFLLTLLVAASTFTLFPWVNDCQILSRWLTGPAVVLVLLLGYQTNGLRNAARRDQSEILSGWFNAFGYALLAVIGIHMVISIGELSGIIPDSSPFKGTVSFDNPAGFAAMVVAGMPIIGYALGEHRKGTAERILLSVVVCMSFLLLFLIRSRAGIIALLASMVFMLLAGKQKRGIKILVLGILGVCAIAGVWYLSVSKQNSTYGRLLILETCWQMIKDAPLLGHGPGGFRRLYMTYQANILDSMPDADIRFLADNVTNPLNEYVRLTVNFGFAGLALIAALIGVAVKFYASRRNRMKDYAMASIVSIAALALFSYPFQYPLTWIILSFDALVLIHPVHAMKTARSFTIGITFPLTCAVLLGFAFWSTAQIRWYRLSHHSNDLSTDAVVAGYARLQRWLGKDPYFMYNEAYTLHNCGMEAEALLAAEKSSAQKACYDTELLLAEICLAMSEYGKAIEHLSWASSMCPVRFVPEYRLFCIYQEQGDTESMITIGNRILDKPVKVNSPTVRNIRLEVRKALIAFH